MANRALNSKFDKDLLPDPKDYFMQTVGLKLKGRGVWRMAKCPFHDDTTESLAVQVVLGCFKCHACGAKGGDLIAFHMQLKGCGFKQACIDLGIWSDSYRQRGVAIWEK